MKRHAIDNAIKTTLAITECPVCKKQAKWLLPNIEGTDDLEIMAMVAPRNPILGFHFAPLICCNCGATQLFHIDTLMTIHGAEHDET